MLVQALSCVASDKEGKISIKISSWSMYRADRTDEWSIKRGMSRNSLRSSKNRILQQKPAFSLSNGVVSIYFHEINTFPDFSTSKSFTVEHKNIFDEFVFYLNECPTIAGSTLAYRIRHPFVVHGQFFALEFHKVHIFVSPANSEKNHSFKSITKHFHGPQ